jgi:aldehyde:ferredoxin oxidoreductase
MQPILKIDLSTRDIGAFNVPAQWEQDFLGGASLAARILYDYLAPDIDPLAPQAPILFINGPLSGTSGPATGRFVICGRSPATRLWGESNCGGFWGPELRQAGFDGLLVTGKAEQPVYLWIQDGQVEIREAAHLWGLDTYSTHAAIAQELNQGKVQVACIGPAGEACIPYALILVDQGSGRSGVAGRTGMGAVMGSKNLKAVAVQGHGVIPVVGLQKYTPLRSEANRQLRADAMTQVLRELGTAGAAEYLDYLGEMPKRYFQDGTFPEELKIAGSYVKETILTGISACQGCVIACGRVVKLEDGEKRKGPEYETLMGFGPNLMLNDAPFATRMGELCDRYGMDSISLSGTIGLAYKLYDMGKITKEDTGGLELTWGNPQPVEPLVHMTLRREGFGAYIAGGSLFLGQQFGAPEEAVQVKGLEAAYHDPRGASGMALVYATSPRGACHNQSDYFFVDMGQVEASLGLEFHGRHGGSEKAKNVAIHQDWRTVFNSLVMCIFANVPPETVTTLINAACGLHWQVKDMLRCGERGWNMKRLVNLRLGLTRGDDTLPEPMMRPYSDCNLREELNCAVDFGDMLQAYYEARGWDPETGIPTDEKLHELGLEFKA